VNQNTATDNCQGKILIVDDSEDIREILAELLSLSDFEVLQAEDGEKGYNLIKENRFDIVIADVLMPKMTGLELFRKVSEDGYEMEFVLLSGLDPKDQLFLQIKDKAVTVIGKPFELNDIHNLVNTLMQKKQKAAA
jgi:two-component system, NtrC family, nitrogen regulation response regulator NtrX